MNGPKERKNADATGSLKHNKNSGTTSAMQSQNGAAQSGNPKWHEFPKKDVAILIASRNGIDIGEYVKSVGKLVGPSNVKFASKIPNGMVCMYLASKELVDSLTESNKTIKIGKEILEIRAVRKRLIRLLMFNVWPTVPHGVVLNALTQLSIRFESRTMRFLEAGFLEPGYAHVLNFAREVYIRSDDASKVPRNLKINYDYTDYLAFLSTAGPLIISNELDPVEIMEIRESECTSENQNKIKEDKGETST